jgi:hypothetical protein
MVFNATVSNISVISWSVLLMGETGVPRENHRPVASHWPTLSHIMLYRVHLAIIYHVQNLENPEHSYLFVIIIIDIGWRLQKQSKFLIQYCMKHLLWLITQNTRMKNQKFTFRNALFNQRLIDGLVFNVSFSSISAILWPNKR